jgi:CCR4-NOT transcription complex subunit 1
MFTQVNVTNISQLPNQHDIHVLLRQIPLIISQSYNKEEVALLMTQRVLNLLFKHETQLPLGVYVLLLERLCELSKKVAKEVFQWLLYHDDDVSRIILLKFRSALKRFFLSTEKV